MALGRDRIEAAGLATAVPSFEALAQVQDKVSAYRTLARLGVPQPPAVIAASAAELAEATRLPVFVKTPIGTASAGVRRVRGRNWGGWPGSTSALASSPAEAVRGRRRCGRRRCGRRRCGRRRCGRRRCGPEGVRSQKPVAGPLAMVQAVFADGELVAFHACQRVREGPRGGVQPQAGRTCRGAGAHGRAGRGAGLARRAVRGRDHRTGGPGSSTSTRGSSSRSTPWPAASTWPGPWSGGRTGTSRTAAGRRARGADPPVLLAVLGTAQPGRPTGRGRRAGPRGAAPRRVPGQPEELTPGRGDPLAPVPVVASALATLAGRLAWRRFVGERRRVRADARRMARADRAPGRGRHRRGAGTGAKAKEAGTGQDGKPGP